MNIELKVKPHDRFQVEFKTVYPISHEHKISEYNADVFFFLPRNLSVNPYTFTGKDFYNDFSEYIRFKTPIFTLADLVAPDNPAVMRLKDSIYGLPGTDKEFSQCLKMFCSIVKSSLRDSSAEIKKNVEGDQKKLLLEYLDNAQKVLKTFRAFKSEFARESAELELFGLADEFLSVTANRYAYSLWKHFKHKFPDDTDIKDALVKSTFEEIQHRKVNKYRAVPDENGDNSELLYRESALKKSLANILFLNVETRKDGIMLENIFMAFAAAVAMIFVTAIAFAWQGFSLEDFSVSFFIVWVIAYMFKDRIKSQLQLYFLSKRSRYSYDYRQKIFDGYGNEVGIFREGFRHCDGKDIDEKISKVRNRTIVSKMVNGSLEENVLVYRKKIELRGDACKNIFREFNVEGVVNIYRLNVRHWLNKMDNPIRQICCSDGKNINPLAAHRDYHVNIVVRIGGKNCREQYVRYRLVLCRNGIRRLEKF